MMLLLLFIESGKQGVMYMKKFDGRKKLYAKRVLMECVIMVLMLCGCSDHTVDNPFSKDTGYQVEMVKDQSDDKGQTICDYKIFHKKDGLLMQDVYGDAMYGDIDGDGKCEAAFVTMEGSGIQRMCVYVVDADKKVAVSKKLDVMYDIFDIKGIENVGDIKVKNGQMKKNEIQMEVSGAKYKIEMEADGTAAGTVDGAETKVITASDIGVQNITENLKRSFEEAS